MVAYAVKTPPQHGTWSEILGLWQSADDIEVFESAWTMDHFYPLSPPRAIWGRPPAESSRYVVIPRDGGHWPPVSSSATSVLLAWMDRLSDEAH